MQVVPVIDDAISSAPLSSFVLVFNATGAPIAVGRGGLARAKQRLLAAEAARTARLSHPDWLPRMGGSSLSTSGRVLVHLLFKLRVDHRPPVCSFDRLYRSKRVFILPSLLHHGSASQSVPLQEA